MAMVPMMILTMGIIESSALTLTQRLISMKATDIGRLITNGGLIGQSQAASMEAIRSAVCNQGILGLAQSSCHSSLMIDVRRVDGSPIPPMVVGGALNGAAFTYQATSGSDILLLRLALPFRP